MCYFDFLLMLVDFVYFVCFSLVEMLEYYLLLLVVVVVVVIGLLLVVWLLWWCELVVDVR